MSYLLTISAVRKAWKLPNAETSVVQETMDEVEGEVERACGRRLKIQPYVNEKYYPNTRWNSYGIIRPHNTPLVSVEGVSLWNGSTYVPYSYNSTNLNLSPFSFTRNEINFITSRPSVSTFPILLSYTAGFTVAEIMDLHSVANALFGVRWAEKSVGDGRVGKNSVGAGAGGANQSESYDDLLARLDRAAIPFRVAKTRP